jgi:hypothetical protein
VIPYRLLDCRLFSSLGLRYKQTMRRSTPMAWAVFLMPLAGFAQLHIRIVEGDGAINSIRFHRAYDPVVQVLNPANRPVAGATVTFVLPATGASATFADKSLSLTTQTDARGTARSHGMRPNRAAGQLEIRVAASWKGEAASAIIQQTNVEEAKPRSAGKRVLLLALIGGGLAGGLIAATHAGRGSSSPSPTSGAASTIVAGTPSIGAPH